MDNIPEKVETLDLIDKAESTVLNTLKEPKP